MYLYKTDNFFYINLYLKSVSKVALLHRFYCMYKIRVYDTNSIQAFVTASLARILYVKTVGL